MIAVPHVGGVLLVASSSVTYVGPDGGGVQGIMMNDTIITSHCVMDEAEGSTSDFQRFLLGDMRGAMSILILQVRTIRRIH